jgi:hypothetical protein
VFGIVLELLVVEKYLLTRCKHEICSAVYTLEHSIDELHGRLPSQGLTPKSAMDLEDLPVPVP